MVDVLVSLWDGQKGAWRKATKTQGDDLIMNPWINILACTTPAWIAGNFPEYMIGGGFTSRCLFVYAETKRQLIAYPGHDIPRDFSTQEADLLHDLEIISQMKGEYRLTPEATAYGRQWYEEHFSSRPAHLNEAQFGGYIARKQTHIHKLAIILSASGSNNLAIERDALEIANTMVSALEFDMPKVFKQVGSNDQGRYTELVLDIIRTRRKITKQALYREFVGKLAATDIDAGLQALIIAGYVKMHQQGDRILLVYQGDEGEEELKKVN